MSCYSAFIAFSGGENGPSDRLVVSHIEGNETIRIISARLASAAERKRHET